MADEEPKKQGEEEDKEIEASDDNDDKLSRKYSAASVASTDANDDDGEDNEEKKSILLGPPVALKDQLELDKDDESLRKWKEQLLGDVDLNDVGETLEPEVHIQSLTIVSPERDDMALLIPFIPNAKGFAFALKDGSKYRLKFTFTVSNNIVSGLRYTNTVWKAGVRGGLVGKFWRRFLKHPEIPGITFSPQKEPYIYELGEETTPSGMFARGSYSARTKFVDDDGKIYLDISYFFEIRKDWA